MITNADITIYNRKLNPTTKLPEYQTTQIKGVHWYTDQKIAVSDKGAASADIYKIRVPSMADQSGKTYAAPLEYAKAKGIENLWTIQNQDIVVKGLLDLEIKKAMDLEGYEKATVVSFSDNRQGSLPHWRIGGV